MTCLCCSGTSDLSCVGSLSLCVQDVEPGQLRLLEVDERLVLPTNSLVRLLVTSADVIHSWAVPSLGVKIDAIPGRLNQVRETAPGHAHSG